MFFWVCSVGLRGDTWWISSYVCCSDCVLPSSTRCNSIWFWCWSSGTAPGCGAGTGTSTIEFCRTLVLIGLPASAASGALSTDQIPLESKPAPQILKLKLDIWFVRCKSGFRPVPGGGMVHAWVGQKLVKGNIFTSFIQCHKVVMESLFYISYTYCLSIFLNN